MTPARAFLAFAAWAAVTMSWAVAWVFAVGRMPPYWLTAVVGLATFAVVEVGGRVRVRRRGSRWRP